MRSSAFSQANQDGNSFRSSLDLGRGRAWLRSSLNENSLDRYMLMILEDGISVRGQFYEDWAILNTQVSALYIYILVATI